MLYEELNDYRKLVKMNVLESKGVIEAKEEPLRAVSEVMLSKIFGDVVKCSVSTGFYEVLDRFILAWRISGPFSLSVWKALSFFFSKPF